MGEDKILVFGGCMAAEAGFGHSLAVRFAATLRTLSKE
jgi:hypothetical protein